MSVLTEQLAARLQVHGLHVTHHQSGDITASMHVWDFLANELDQNAAIQSILRCEIQELKNQVRSLEARSGELY